MRQRNHDQREVGWEWSPFGQGKASLRPKSRKGTGQAERLQERDWDVQSPLCTKKRDVLLGVRGGGGEQSVRE